MISIASLLRTMVSLFAAMALGFLAVRLRMVGPAFKSQLTRLVIYMIHPFMILSSVLNTEHLLTNGQVLQLSGMAVCCYLVLIPLSLLVVRLLKVPAGSTGTYRFMLIFSNMGFMGYPVVRALFGESAVFYVSIFVLVFQLVVYTYGVALLSEARERRFRWNLFLRPMVVAALLAFLIYLTGLQIPAAAAEVVQYIGNISTPLCMIVIGCTLAEIPLRSVVGNWRLYILVLLKMILLPLAVFFLLRPLIHNTLLLGILTVILAMPVASNANMMTLEFGGDQDLSAAGVFITTIASIFTIPAIMWLLFAR